jgi:hypothetical protein
MAHRAYTQVDGRPYESPKTHTGRAPFTAADNGDNFLELAKEFHTKVIAEFEGRRKLSLERELPEEKHVIEFVVDGAVVDPSAV